MSGLHGARTAREPLLERVGRLVVRRRRAVLGLAFVGLVLAAAVGGGAIERLSTGGFVDPDAESSRATALLAEEFGGGEPNYLLLVEPADGGSVDDPAVVRAARTLTARLAARDGVAQVRSYWTLGSPASLRNTDGSAALVLARLAGDDDRVKQRAGELSAELTGTTDPLLVRAGGAAEVYREVAASAEADLVRAESYAFPLTFLALVVVFGAVVAASLPLVIGAVAVVGTLLVLTVLTAVTDVSIFALNLTTALGLGLAIDYSLFVVRRFREELARGADPWPAVVTTVATAGRTVLFSAITVALSLAALLVFPLYFLRSFAYAGIPVVLVAALGAVVVLPALLAVLGRRVDRFAVRRVRPAKHGRAHRGVWGRLARLSTRRPVPVATGAVVVLLLLGAPFLAVTFGLTDDRNLPPTSTAAQVHDQLRTEFTARESDPVTVVSAERTSDTELAAYAARLSTLTGVDRVDSAVGHFATGRLAAPAGPATAALTEGDGTWLNVVPSVEAMSPAGEALVERVRATPAPVEVMVGGSAARLVDTKAVIVDRLPVALAVIVVSVGLLLFVFTGGLLVPLKALLVNALSLTATFGVLVWGFQEGALSGLLGDFTVTGTTDIATPVLLFCVAFGLSMDYEVFLLSRMREEWDRTGDNTAAVVAGVERTGGLVTSAAVLVSIVFLSFATAGITSLKMLGIGLTVAVVVDTTLVRGALVPAVMRLAGPANWWAPRALRRLHVREAAPAPNRRPTPHPVPTPRPILSREPT